MTEKRITPENIHVIMKEMLDDPKSMAIWTEILISNENESKNSQKITANDLFDRLDIGKSILYTRLNSLVTKGVIDVEIIRKDTEKKKHVPETIYTISKEFLDVYRSLIADAKNQLNHLRDYRLFHLYIVNAFLIREIRLMSSQSNEEITKNANDKHYYGIFHTLNGDEYIFFQNQMKKVHIELKKYRQENEVEKEERDYLTFRNEYFYYSGFLKIK